MMRKSKALPVIQEAGGPSVVGRALNISPQAVGQWQRVPAERVLALSEFSGKPPHEIRADIYPPPPNEPNTASSDNTAGRAGGSFSHPISETEKSRSLGGAASRSASLGGDQSSSELQSLSAPVGAGEST